MSYQKFHYIEIEPFDPTNYFIIIGYNGGHMHTFVIPNIALINTISLFIKEKCMWQIQNPNARQVLTPRDLNSISWHNLPPHIRTIEAQYVKDVAELIHMMEMQILVIQRRITPAKNPSTQVTLKKCWSKINGDEEEEWKAFLKRIYNFAMRPYTTPMNLYQFLKDETKDIEQWIELERLAT